MKDGTYSLELCVAGEVRRDGSLSVSANALRGGNGTYTVNGSIERMPSLKASLRFELDPVVGSHPGVLGPFALDAQGVERNERFSLVGLGPLGAIIELSGSRVAALAEDVPLAA